ATCTRTISNTHIVFYLEIRNPQRSPLFPYTTLFRSSLRSVPAGAGVGYNATFVAKRLTRIGVLAAGYGDGILRSLGNRGNVLLRSEEHTSELQSLRHLVCRLLLEKKKKLNMLTSR